jgi:hypothetical protein
MASRRLRREDYTVGWVCALPVELAAARVILDERHQDLSRNDNDTNIYTLGRIGEHNVVIACLPAGQTGNNSAAEVVVQMNAAFPSIRFGLMVGIGGGVPSAGLDIRLGDVCGEPTAFCWNQDTNPAPQPSTMYIAIVLCLPRQSSNECSFNLLTHSTHGGVVQYDLLHQVYQEASPPHRLCP